MEKPKPPCNECKYRSIDCHIICYKYIQFTRDLKHYNHIVKSFYWLEGALNELANNRGRNRR